MAKNKTDELAARVAALRKRQEAEQEAERKAAQAPSTADELEAARAELKAAIDEQNAAEVERMRPTERKRIEQVVKLAGELKAAVDELAETHAEIRRHGGFPKANMPPVLTQALAQASTVWRMYGTWHGAGGTLRNKRPDPPGPRFEDLPKKRQGRLVTMAPIDIGGDLEYTQE